MFFKNLLIYHVNLPSLTPDSLELALDSDRAKACTKHDLETCGFVSPFTGRPDGLLVHAAAGHMLMAFQSETKILPPSVVRDAVKEKVDQIQEAEGRPVLRKERAQIRDEIILELLPRAFTKKSVLNAFFTSDLKFLVVDATTGTKAEIFMSHLRMALGTLPAIPLKCKGSPEAEMTCWLDNGRENAPDGFTVGRSCELHNPLEAGSAIRCKDVDLDSEEVQACLESGMRCTKLHIDWQEKLSFMMNNDLTFRGLRFGDVLFEEADESDDERAQRDAHFVLMAGTVREFITHILAALDKKDGPDQLDMVGDAA